MHVAIFGAAGPTGLWACRLALEAGHQVRAVSRRDDSLPLPTLPALSQVRADVQTGDGVADAVAGVDAVLSTLGAPYGRKPITVYSIGTRHIVEAMRQNAAGRRLVVVSSGLTYPPAPRSWAFDHVVVPLLRNVVGRTLYADMRRMEAYLSTVDDLDWTVLRPGRLINADAVSAYRLDPDDPASSVTTRADLAAAMVAQLEATAAYRQALAPSSPSSPGSASTPKGLRP